MSSKHKSKRITKSSAYVNRLLNERPITTAGGNAYHIKSDGWIIHVDSYLAMNRKYAVYQATDYPSVFGWQRPKHMPWAYGTEVRAIDSYRLNNCVNGKKSGKPAKVMDCRLADNGTYEYRVSGWQGNLMWVDECYLVVISEPLCDCCNEYEGGNCMDSECIEEEKVPTLEEKVDAIMEHLGITVEIEPAKIVVKEKEATEDYDTVSSSQEQEAPLEEDDSES